MLFGVFWIVALGFYWKTRGGGFVSDSIGWFLIYETHGWKGLFGSFQEKSLHYIYHLILFSLYKLFAFNGAGWVLIYTFLHALNALWLFFLFSRLLKPVASSLIIALLGSVMFLISPHQTEAVVWAACVHYLVATFLLLSTFLLLLKFYESPSLREVLLFYVCFLLALFSLEIAIAFPLILIAFILFWHSSTFGRYTRTHALKTFAIPSILIVSGYFLLNRLLLGKWVGHYGAATHLNLDVNLLSSNFNKYLTKFLINIPFCNQRQKIYDLFENDSLATASCMLYVGAIACVLLNIIKTRRETKNLTVLITLYALALSPVINIHFNVLSLVEGDRLGYFASAFFYPTAAFSAVLLFRRFGFVLIMTLLLLNVRFLNYNTESWKQVSHLSSSLVEKFGWHEAPAICILNIADNYRGAYMFRTYGDTSSLAEHILVRNKIDLREKITEVAYFNMTTPFDSVKVTAESSQRMKVEFAQWGNWWWRKGIGASNYQSKHFTYTLGEWNSYTMKLNSVPDAGTVFIYQCGDSWRQLNILQSR